MKKIFEYYINLDERGEFKADVRNENQETVLEIDETIFENGFMRQKNDLTGLFKYLVSVRIMSEFDSLTSAS